jgi:uncharacterized protein
VSATVDANILLYASDSGSSRRPRAAELLAMLAAGPEIVYLFWPAVIGYIRIATHPRVFSAPLSLAEARVNVETLLSRAHIRSAGEQEGFWDAFTSVGEDGAVKGNLVSDAHLVALMRQHGVSTIWTADRDFRRFSGLIVKDPFT